MNHAKRGLAVLVVAILLLGMTAQAAVYEHFPDVPEDSIYTKEINTLAEWGIFKGDTNGNFYPQSTITRAEFATIMCRLLDVEDEALTIKTSSFSDVPSSYWACGYITKAVQLELVSGYGDGRFGPADTLTCEQALTILVRYLGEQNAADSNGGYPNGYFIVADEMGITSSTNVKIGDSATREVVAVFIYNALGYQI